MTLPQLLASLSDVARDYIASRDYGNDAAKQREQLDIVIEQAGSIDMPTQSWFPYEVVELCKNQFEFGHEREFAACMAIILKNILDGRDKSTDVEAMLEHVAPEMGKLPPELQLLLNGLFDAFIQQA